MARIKILDSLRGMAALIVVFHHIFTRLNYLFINFPKFLNDCFRIISGLNVEAVLFFFLLSGFSIRLSLRNNIVFSKELLNDYLYRRFRRILPLYFLSLFFTLITGLALSRTQLPDYSALNFAGNMFFLQISKSFKGYWFAPYGDNGPLWSLPFEMFYYIFFPFFSILIFKVFKDRVYSLRVMQLTLVLSLFISIICVIVNKYFFFPYIAYMTLFFTWYSGFYLSHIYMSNQLKVTTNFFSISIITVSLFILMIFTTSDSIDKLFSGSIIMLILFLCLFLQRRYKSFFYPIKSVANFLFYKIGKGSYALYLLHFPLLLCLKYFHLSNLLIVLFVFGLFTIMCVFLEEFLVKQKFLFLKIRYMV